MIASHRVYEPELQSPRRSGDSFTHRRERSRHRISTYEYLNEDTKNGCLRDSLGEWTVRARNGLYIRSKPDTKAESIGILKYKEEVTVYKCEQGWVKHSRGWSLMQNRNNLVALIQRPEKLKEVIIDSCGNNRINFVHLPNNNRRIKSSAAPKQRSTSVSSIFSRGKSSVTDMKETVSRPTQNSNSSEKIIPKVILGSGDASPRRNTTWMSSSPEMELSCYNDIKFLVY